MTDPNWKNRTMRRTLVGTLGALALLVALLPAEAATPKDPLRVRDLVYAKILGGDLRAYIAGVLAGQKWASILLSSQNNPLPRLICPPPETSLEDMQGALFRHLGKWERNRYDSPAGRAVVAILETEYPCK